MQPPEVPPSESLRHRVRLRTRWVDEDNQGVLNNAVYMTLFEEGRHDYFARLGLLARNRFPFLLAQTNVRFLRPGRGGEEVTLEMGTTHLGRSSFRQAYRVVDDGGVVWAEAEAALVVYDPETGRPREMPDEFRGALAEYEGL